MNGGKQGLGKKSNAAMLSGMQTGSNMSNGNIGGVVHA